MSSDIPKDWEKEYHESFTKKIPFPSFRYDSIRLNPAIEGLMYSFTTVSIHNALKFELYVQYGTCAELNNIVRELKEKKLAEEAAKPKEEEKKEEEKKEEEKKEGAELPPANLPKAPSGDLTEKALNILTERRRNQRKEQIEELKKKEEEERKKKEEEAKKRKEIDGKAKKEGDKEEDKKMNEEKKEDDDKGEEEEKKENVDEVYEDSETMYLFETESTYLEDMKNCKDSIMFSKINFSEFFILTIKKTKEIK